MAFLTDVEMEARLAAPDQPTWAGRRDRTLLRLAVQAGLRVSEVSGRRWHDSTLGTGAHVRCQGQGRQERCLPLRKATLAALRAWQRAPRRRPAAPGFPSTRGGPLGRDGGAWRLITHGTTAPQHCPSFQGKRVSPQVLRHSAAMAALHSGGDGAVIALWLGHESMDTPQRSLHARRERQQQALAKTPPVNGQPGRYRPEDALLAFLKSLSYWGVR